MRICVLADTHLNVSGALAAVRVLEEVDLLIHLGDCVVDVEKVNDITEIPFIAVPGNKDWHCQLPEEVVFEVGGVTMMALHGHQYDINAYESPKSRMEKFSQIAADAHVAGAELVLYGHDHQPAQFKVNEVSFFNPGELTLGSYRCSFGLIIADAGKWSGEILNITCQNN